MYMQRQRRTLGSYIAIASRWLDLVLLSVAAIVTVMFTKPLIDVLANEVEKSAHLWSCWVAFGCALVITFLFWIVVTKLRGNCFRGLLSLPSNPPVWLFGVISAVAYAKLYTLFYDSPRFLEVDITKDTLFASVIFVLIGFTTCFARFVNNKIKKWIESSRRVSMGRSPDFADLSEDAVELIKWLNREQPILTCQQDRFDMAVFARRIMRTLTAKRMNTIGLVGPYGCGKSSILHMAEECMSTACTGRRKVITCWVSGWGFREGSATEHVLQSAVRQLSKYTDCISLVNVPARYQKALSECGGHFGRALCTMLTGWERRKEELSKLDFVLARIGKRLVIFLEDIDRNQKTEVFFNEITALLDGLKVLDHVSFVLALGPGYQGYRELEVLLKTCEHIEAVPGLDRRRVAKICMTFRNYCWQKLDKTVACISVDTRDKRMGILKKVKDHEDYIEYLELLPDNPLGGIVTFLDSPRVLKQALRRTLVTWQQLYNEINFDDLLVTNVIRASAPELFVYINRNITTLRSLSNAESKEKAEKDRETLRLELEKIVEKKSYDGKAAAVLIEFLFPGWTKPEGNLYPSMRESERKYQRVENDWPTDYWVRLNREELLADEIPDKDILMAIGAWNQNKEAKALKQQLPMRVAIDDEGVFEKLRQFKERIHKETIQELAEEQFRATLKEHKNRASMDNCPAVGSWWQLVSTDTLMDESLHQWLLGEIYKAMSISLGYVNDLYATWFKQLPALRRDIVAKAKEVYCDKPEVLINVLDPEEIGSISHFSYYYSLEKQGGQGFDPKEWRWLADTILKAGKLNPQIIVPQIPFLLVEVERRPGIRNGEKPMAESVVWDGDHIWIGKFVPDRAQKLFTDQFSELMRLLASDIDHSGLKKEQKAYVIAAHMYAKSWLSEHHPEP